MPFSNRYIIVREDLVQDPVTIITEGLLLGRLRQCELLLNHPSVSRVQAGIKQIEGVFYVFSLRSSNPVILNRKPVEENEALAPGDVIDVGPFRLETDFTEDALVLTVSLRIGMVASAADVSSPEIQTADLPEAEGKKAKARPAPIAGNKALDIFWDKRIREAGKMVKPSPLFPRGRRRTGKAQFNWSPTSDLGRRWPIAFFTWSTIIVGALSAIAAMFYTSIYAPGAVSQAHVRSDLSQFPSVAARPNANACTTCHSLSGNMEQRCANCHNTEVFVATVIKPHADAGIGCMSCHSEHRGDQFRAATAAFGSCSDCHADSNKHRYNGRTVSTPHGGTFGYPVVAGKWVWTGVDAEEWKLKQISVQRLPEETEEQWRSKQFHAIHVYRVKSVGELEANAEGQLSCSSCHKTFNPAIDRETPRTTCGNCHNGKIDPGSGRSLIAGDKPNCTSCHVQHIHNKRHWDPPLLAAKLALAIP
jgi:pSer/pThr/pTyr-binding forkhead associated (FHA) protein